MENSNVTPASATLVNRKVNARNAMTSNPIRLSFSRPRFTTDGNVTTCELHYKIKHTDTVRVRKDRSGLISMISFGDTEFDDRKYVSTGQAVCSANDAFDKRTGRRIAQARAEENAYRDASAHVAKFRMDLIHELDSAEEFMKKSAGVINHNKTFVKEIGDNLDSKN